MRDRQHAAQQIALLALFLALAMLLGYVESLLPLPFGIPGIKLGLCNLVLLFLLLRFSWKEALLVSVLRVLLLGFLFGNLFSIGYGLAGAVCSMLAMSLLLATQRFGVLGISAAGGAAHTMGQLLFARLVLPGLPLLWYLPVLLLAGVLTGLLVGFLCSLLLVRVPMV